MKTKLISFIIIIFACLNVQATIDHTFTYQGELIDNGSPAQGVYDITIHAFDNDSASGISLSSSIHTDVSVEAGVFTINQVNLSNSIFDGMDVWLQLLVKKSAEANFTALSPLQKMRSVPYANSLIDKGAVDGQVLTFSSVNGWQPNNIVFTEDDNQNISGSGLSSTFLTIGIENGAGEIVDLSSLQDGTGTDNQNISGSQFSGTTLTIGIEGGTSEAINLASLQDGGAKKLDELSDAKSDSDGTDNNSSVFIGFGSGVNDDSSNNQNVGLGNSSLSNNITGNNNTANGFFSLFQNTTGTNNTAIGSRSLLFNIDGSGNTANGTNTLYTNSTGIDNTANGYESLYSNSTGNYNTASGAGSLRSNTLGLGNTANGVNSLYSNTEGSDNTASGTTSLYFNVDGNKNTANGGFSLYSNLGSSNTASGYYALFSNQTGGFNTAIGDHALSTGVGFFNSTAIGYNAQVGFSNTIRLGNSDVSSIGGFANWSNVSDVRFKTNIKEDVPGLKFIKKLRPVTYQLNMDAIAAFNNTPNNLRLLQSETKKAAELQTGFIAQEVEAAAKSLGYDFHGVDKPKNDTSHYGLRYAEFVVPLVKAVQELSDANQKLKSENQLLKDRLDHIEQLLLIDSK